MNQALLIINPKSGVEKHKDFVVEAAAARCDKSGLCLDVEFTSGPGDAFRLARKAAEEGVAHVIVAGGDGTIRDAANGLWASQSILGIVPLGSGNGLARSMSVSQVVEKALDIAVEGHFATIDRGMANESSFYSAFGIGVDADVSYRFSKDKRRGRTTYIKHAIKELFSCRPRKFHLTMGQNEIKTEAMLIAVCNCQQYGNNAYIAPKADPTDGKLDITVIHSGNFISKMIAGIDLFSGTLDKNVLVENFRAPAVDIVEEEAEGNVITHLDGEPMEMSPRVSIRCEEAGLRVAVPKEVHPFKPVFTPMRSILDDMVLDIRKMIKPPAQPK